MNYTVDSVGKVIHENSTMELEGKVVIKNIGKNICKKYYTNKKKCDKII